MRWGKEREADWPTPFSLRYVERTAYIPEYDTLNKEWVWLERYVAEEYWSPNFRAWRSTAGMGTFEGNLVVSDCRKAP